MESEADGDVGSDPVPPIPFWEVYGPFDITQQFDPLARRGGDRLTKGDIVDSLQVWLSKICQERINLEPPLDPAYINVPQGTTIKNLTQSSAMLCDRLQSWAIEKERRDNAIAAQRLPASLSTAVADPSVWAGLATEFELLNKLGTLSLEWQRTYGARSVLNGKILHDFVSGRTLYLKFKLLAQQAGLALGSSAEDPLDRWVSQLIERDVANDPQRQRDPIGPESTPGGEVWHQTGRLNDVCSASVDRCLELQLALVSRSSSTTRLSEPEPVQINASTKQPDFRAEVGAARSTVEVVAQNVSGTDDQKLDESDKHDAGPTFPRRAAWLRERLKERGWDRNNLYPMGGPDRKTVQKLLDGKYVRAEVFARLIAALNHQKVKGVTVGLTDIPSD